MYRRHYRNFRFIGVMFWAFPYLLWQSFGHFSGFFVGLLLAVILTFMLNNLFRQRNWNMTRQPVQIDAQQQQYQQEYQWEAEPYQYGYRAQPMPDREEQQPHQVNEPPDSLRRDAGRLSRNASHAATISTDTAKSDEEGDLFGGLLIIEPGKPFRSHSRGDPCGRLPAPLSHRSDIASFSSYMVGATLAVALALYMWWNPPSFRNLTTCALCHSAFCTVMRWWNRPSFRHLTTPSKHSTLYSAQKTNRSKQP